MKKIFLILLIAVCCGAVLFAGGNKNTSTSTSPVLTVWHIWASDTESTKIPFENAVRAFQATYPDIKLEVEATENEAYKTKIRTAVAGNQAPDVFFHWTGGSLQGFVDAGAILPLDSYLDSATMNKILPGTLGVSTYNNQVLALPYAQDAACFFVNEEMFSQNGLKVPTTWDELLAVCQAFLDRGITPFTVGGKEDWCLAQYFEVIHLRQAGFKLTNDVLTGAASFNNPDTIEAARKFQQLIDVGAFGPNSLGLTRDEAEVLFYQGRVPMYINGNWTIGNINRADTPVNGKIGIHPFPVLGRNGTLRDLTGGVSGGFMASSKTKYPNEAATFVKFISERLSVEMYKTGAGIPTWQTTVSESVIDPLTRNLVNLFKEIDTYTMWWDVFLTDKMPYLNNLTRLFAKQLTPEQFAQALAAAYR